MTVFVLSSALFRQESSCCCKTRRSGVVLGLNTKEIMLKKKLENTFSLCFSGGYYYYYYCCCYLVLEARVWTDMVLWRRQVDPSNAAPLIAPLHGVLNFPKHTDSRQLFEVGPSGSAALAF